MTIFIELDLGKKSTFEGLTRRDRPSVVKCDGGAGAASPT